MVPAKRRIINLYVIHDDETSPPASCSSPSSVEVASHPKKLKPTSSTSTSRPNTTPDWLPDGWTVGVWIDATGQTYEVFKETTTRKKFYSKPEVLHYLAISDSSDSNKTRVEGPKTPKLSTSRPNTIPDWLPDGWTVGVWIDATGQTYEVFKETATRNKFYSKPEVLDYLAISDSSDSNKTKVEGPKTPKLSTSTSERRYWIPDPWALDVSWLPPGWSVSVAVKSSTESRTTYLEHVTRKKFNSKQEVLNYIAIADSSNSNMTQVNVAPPKEKQVSTLSTKPLEIPKSLYDLIQKVARFTKSLKLNPNNRFAASKLEYYKPLIPIAVSYHRAIEELPRDWNYDPETFFMAHVPKPPTPPKPKRKTKKKIKITWKSDNYHGRYLLNYNELDVWNLFVKNEKIEKIEANESEVYPLGERLHTVDDGMFDNLVGNFAVNIFNKSCKMYVNKDEDNMVSGAEFMECKFYKMTSKYIFYITIEATEQGIPGVYTTSVECVTENGAMTLQNFVLTGRQPKWKRPWVKPRLEPKVEYETVQDGSSDPQDFYKLTGMVHRDTDGGGFNYHNPEFSPHIISYTSGKDEEASAFVPNLYANGDDFHFLASTKTIPLI